jgi:membrane protein DedA with SNARE-associated domain
MTLETIVVQFGYPALIIGLLFEGETMLVLGAFMAHRGYLDLRLVILIGCLVSFASDQFFFWMGRLKGNQFLESRPALKSHVEKAKSLLSWNTNLLFIGIRFMYGLRTALSFVIGMAKFDSKKFMVLDLIGAFLWALTFGLAGQLIGQLMAGIFDELVIALGIILVGAGVWLYRRYADKMQKAK